MERDDFMAAFAALANALGGEQGRDVGAMMPQSDVDDFRNGARWIPGEVTLARRRGEKVDFVQEGEQSEWYWQMPDGRRIFHGTIE